MIRRLFAVAAATSSARLGFAIRIGDNDVPPPTTSTTGSPGSSSLTHTTTKYELHVNSNAPHDCASFMKERVTEAELDKLAVGDVSAFAKCKVDSTGSAGKVRIHPNADQGLGDRLGYYVAMAGLATTLGYQVETYWPDHPNNDPCCNLNNPKDVMAHVEMPAGLSWVSEGQFGASNVSEKHRDWLGHTSDLLPETTYWVWNIGFPNISQRCYLLNYYMAARQLNFKPAPLSDRREPYIALHLRRGDKFDSPDSAQAAKMRGQRLEEALAPFVQKFESERPKSVAALPWIVLSDDEQAKASAETFLKSHGLSILSDYLKRNGTDVRYSDFFLLAGASAIIADVPTEGWSSFSAIASKVRMTPLFVRNDNLGGHTGERYERLQKINCDVPAWNVFTSIDEFVKKVFWRLEHSR